MSKNYIYFQTESERNAILAALITHAAHSRSLKPGLFVLEPHSGSVSLHLAREALNKIKIPGMIGTVNSVPLNVCVYNNCIDVTQFNQRYGAKADEVALERSRRLFAIEQQLLPHSSMKI